MKKYKLSVFIIGLYFALLVFSLVFVEVYEPAKVEPIFPPAVHH